MPSFYFSTAEWAGKMSSMQSSKTTVSNSKPLAEWAVVRVSRACGALGVLHYNLVQLVDSIQKLLDGAHPGGKVIKMLSFCACIE